MITRRAHFNQYEPPVLIGTNIYLFPLSDLNVTMPSDDTIPFNYPYEIKTTNYLLETSRMFPAIKKYIDGENNININIENNTLWISSSVMFYRFLLTKRTKENVSTTSETIDSVSYYTVQLSKQNSDWQDNEFPLLDTFVLSNTSNNSSVVISKVDMDYTNNVLKVYFTQNISSVNIYYETIQNKPVLDNTNMFSFKMDLYFPKYFDEHFIDSLENQTNYLYDVVFNKTFDSSDTQVTSLLFDNLIIDNFIQDTDGLPQITDLSLKLYSQEEELIDLDSTNPYTIELITGTTNTFNITLNLKNEYYITNQNTKFVLTFSYLKNHPFETRFNQDFTNWLQNNQSVINNKISTYLSDNNSQIINIITDYITNNPDDNFLKDYFDNNFNNYFKNSYSEQLNFDDDITQQFTLSNFISTQGNRSNLQITLEDNTNLTPTFEPKKYKQFLQIDSITSNGQTISSDLYTQEIDINTSNQHILNITFTTPQDLNTDTEIQFSLLLYNDWDQRFYKEMDNSFDTYMDKWVDNNWDNKFDNSFELKYDQVLNDISLQVVYLTKNIDNTNFTDATLITNGDSSKTFKIDITELIEQDKFNSFDSISSITKNNTQITDYDNSQTSITFEDSKYYLNIYFPSSTSFTYTTDETDEYQIDFKIKEIQQFEVRVDKDINDWVDTNWNNKFDNSFNTKINNIVEKGEIVIDNTNITINDFNSSTGYEITFINTYDTKPNVQLTIEITDTSDFDFSFKLLNVSTTGFYIYTNQTETPSNNIIIHWIQMK